MKTVLKQVAATSWLLLQIAGTCAAMAQTSPPGGADQPPAAPTPEPASKGIPPELEPYQGRPVHAIKYVLAKPPEAKPNDAKVPSESKVPSDSRVPSDSKVPSDNKVPGDTKPATDTSDQNKTDAPADLDATTQDLIRNQLRLKEGMPFSAELAAQDMARLNRLGRFKRVESGVQLLGDGSVDVVYTLGLQPIIRSVQSVGNKAFSDQEIGKIIDVLEGTPVDPTRLDRSCRRIEDKYREKGYYNCLVTIDDKELADNSIVLFKVREGEKTKVSRIRFEGNTSFTPRELKTVLKTHEAWLFDRGPLDNEILADDVAGLVGYYRDRGYLDVRCDRVIMPSPNGREAIVTFVIDEGPVYTLRDIKLAFPDGSEKVFTVEQILGIMQLKPGGVYSDLKLKRSNDAVKAAYQKLGYVDIEVRRREQRDLTQPVVDLWFIITEGRSFKTGQVLIRHNTLTRDDVIRREVQYQPDRTLDGTQTEETQQRLRKTSLFAPGSAKVTIQPESPDNPGVRDVLVEVDETNTGSFNIGGAVNSDAGLSAIISLQQRNFDITDTPDTFGEFFGGDAFRGGGQTFTISASPGSERQYYQISLSDPYLFDTNYAGSAAAFLLDRQYSAYDEQRYGGKFSVARRFGSRWTASVPLRIENVDLSSIDTDAPADYFAVGDNEAVMGIGLNLVRSSVDDFARPSKGTKTEVGFEQVGGANSFTTVHGEYSVYAKLAEDVLGRKTVLQLTARATDILQGDSSAPFYERLYLGGSNFRGFRFRGVSPMGFDRSGNQTKDPIGGSFSFFAGAEVRQPLYEDVLAGVLFMDSGTVDTDISLEKYRVSVGFGFRLYVERLSPVPLAFDFGVPIMKEPTDQKRLFTFSVDVPFR